MYLMPFTSAPPPPSFILPLRVSPTGRQTQTFQRELLPLSTRKTSQCHLPQPPGTCTGPSLHTHTHTHTHTCMNKLTLCTHTYADIRTRNPAWFLLFLIVQQRAAPHQAADSSLPRSDPNLSAPDKGTSLTPCSIAVLEASAAFISRVIIITVIGPPPEGFREAL